MDNAQYERMHEAKNLSESLGTLTHNDLHTHLLGCGDHHFWYDELMLDYLRRNNIKYNRERGKRDSEAVACALFPPPVIFDQEEKRFRPREEAEKVFNDITTLGAVNFVEFVGPLWATDTIVRERLLHFRKNNPGFFERWGNGGKIELDVVFSTANLGRAFCTDDHDLDVMLAYICECLTGGLEKFTEHVIFNARKQEFNLVHGITNRRLVKLCSKSKMAENFVRNGFSMLAPDGTGVTDRDFVNLRGHFTPQFYPARFALKDSIYEQRPDVFHRLLDHVERRYHASKPQVRHVEFSIGANDAARLHVMAFLVKRLAQSTCLDQALFPYMGRQNDSTVEFKYLAGFNRQMVNLPLGSPRYADMYLPQVLGSYQRIENQFLARRSLSLLNNFPHRCINLYLQDITADHQRREADIFRAFNDGLDVLKLAWSKEIVNQTILPPSSGAVSSSTEERQPSKESMDVVGFDLFGDEYGAPYCPFATKDFLSFASQKQLGFRVHFGEGVPFTSFRSTSFPAWITHMFLGLINIYTCSQAENAQVRIGHGVAISHLLKANTEIVREWGPFLYVLFAHARTACSVIIPSEAQGLSPFGPLNNIGLENEKRVVTVPVEINVTSNYHLLHGVASPEKVFALSNTYGVRCFLSTDDDGVWPLNGTRETFMNGGLQGEYVLAVHKGLLKFDEVHQMIDNAQFYRFSDKTWTTKRRAVDDEGDSLVALTERVVNDDNFGRKVLFHPSHLALLARLNPERKPRLKRWILDHAKWLQSAFDGNLDPMEKKWWANDDNFSASTYVDYRMNDVDLDERQSCSDLASKLLAANVFGRALDEEEFNSTTLANFTQMISCVCRFKVPKGNAFVVRRNDHHDLWIIQNTTKSLIQGQFQITLKQAGEWFKAERLTGTVNVHIFVEEEKIWCDVFDRDVFASIRGTSPPLSNPRSTSSTSSATSFTNGVVVYYLVGAWKWKDTGNKTVHFLQEFPIFMHVVPLFYHSSIIPLLAKYAKDNDDERPWDVASIDRLVSTPYCLSDLDGLQEKEWNELLINIPLVPRIATENVATLLNKPRLAEFHAPNFTDTERSSTHYVIDGAWEQTFELHYSRLLQYRLLPKDYSTFFTEHENLVDWLIPPFAVLREGKLVERYYVSGVTKETDSTKLVTRVLESLDNVLIPGEKNKYSSDLNQIHVGGLIAKELVVALSYRDVDSTSAKTILVELLEEIWKRCNQVGWYWHTVDAVRNVFSATCDAFGTKLLDAEDKRRIIRKCCDAVKNERPYCLGNYWQIRYLGDMEKVILEWEKSIPAEESESDTEEVNTPPSKHMKMDTGD